MATSKLIKKWIGDKKKTVARLTKDLQAAKTRIKKLEADLKKAAAKEKAAPKKKAPAKKKKTAKKKSRRR